MNVGYYSKTIVTILAAGLGIFTAALSDGVVTPLEIVNIIIALGTAVGVYLIPNLPSGPAKIGKTIVTLAGGALAVLAITVADVTSFSQVSTSDWLAVLLAGLAAIGVYVLPNSTVTSGTTVVNNVVTGNTVEAAEIATAVSKAVDVGAARNGV